MEVHGFCDASSKAYAAVVSTRCTDAQGHSHVSLPVSKTRVAPIKTVSIRLELCGAVLLARLIDQVRSNSTFANSQLYCWTDATIVIAWLQGCPSQWKTFVANRVAEVQPLLPDVSWRHVSSAENPADLATRGSSADEIAKSRQWWHGPSWLQWDESNWPTLAPPLAPDAPLEPRSQTFHATTSNDTTTSAINIFNRFSSWPRMCRVMHRMLLWSRKWRKAHEESNHSYLQMLNDVQSRIFAVLQAEAFPEELKTLAGNQPSPDGSRYLAIGQKFARTSPFRRLNPFLDTTGLLRVGGRLSLAPLSLSAKHPVILPSGHIAGMLIRHAHLRCLNGSIALTLSTVRDRVWILQARKTVKSVIHGCVRCVRYAARTPYQVMGSLPPARVLRPSRAFAECGVDYAGPLQMRLAGGRGYRAFPVYVSVFVCMASRAVHLEVVCTYTSAAFLAAFERFYSRRGLPTKMYSDNGTTFKGADKELRAAYRAAVNS